MTQKTPPVSLALIAVGAIVAGAATTPAVASASPVQKQLVHQTPTVPIVVDGVKYAPDQIHRFDGRALYRYVPRNGKTLIAFTDIKRYNAFLRTKAVRLPASGKVETRTAHASYAGQD